MTRDASISAAERRAVSELLPWYASGRLDAAETARVEAALALDETLREELDIVREDQDAALALADQLPTPSPRVLDRLMERIEAEPEKLAHVAARARAGFADWLGAKLALLSPRTLAYAASAAALALVVQAGLIGYGMMSGGAQFQTASHPAPGAVAPAEGTFLLIGFNPQASAGDIAQLLGEVRGTIVDGPRPGGFYRVRIAAQPLAQADVDRIAATLRGRADVVRFVGPTR